MTTEGAQRPRHHVFLQELRNVTIRVVPGLTHIVVRPGTEDGAIAVTSTARGARIGGRTVEWTEEATPAHAVVVPVANPAPVRRNRDGVVLIDNAFPVGRFGPIGR